MEPRHDRSGVRSYTMRDLNMHTADVIREINETGEQAVITRHGRHVAILVPVANERVEAAVLQAVLEAAREGSSSGRRRARSNGKLLTTGQVCESPN